jgi:hypothetical protein
MDGLLGRAARMHTLARGNAHSEAAGTAFRSLSSQKP